MDAFDDTDTQDTSNVAASPTEGPGSEEGSSADRRAYGQHRAQAAPLPASMTREELLARLALLQYGHDKAQNARLSVKGQLRAEMRKNHTLSLSLALAQRTIARQRTHLTELVVERDRWREDADKEQRAICRRLSTQCAAAIDYANELHGQLTDPESSVYDVAQAAVRNAAEGVPDWLVTIAVNAALTEILGNRADPIGAAVAVKTEG